MTNLDEELKTTVRRNMLLGMWAAAKLGLADRAAESYAKELAVGTLDVERGDVFARIRKDFDAAGVAESDEQILHVMETLMLEASGQVPTARGSSSDAAAIAIKRKITSR